MRRGEKSEIRAQLEQNRTRRYQNLNYASDLATDICYLYALVINPVTVHSHSRISCS